MKHLNLIYHIKYVFDLFSIYLKVPLFLSQMLTYLAHNRNEIALMSTLSNLLIEETTWLQAGWFLGMFKVVVMNGGI